MKNCNLHTILEVGAGLGQNTKYLTSLDRHVTVLEPDSQLSALLERKFQSTSHVEIFHGDLQGIVNQLPRLDTSTVLFT